MTVYEYLVDLRLEGARVALAGTGGQIQRIADSAGYRNASDFSRAFRQRYGIGPREYRRASQSASPVLAQDSPEAPNDPAQ
jgi:AraC-like DNA-binding protein